VVSRRLTLLPGGQAVTIELDAPRPRRGEWTCGFRIGGLGRVRSGRAAGADGLEALQAALRAVRQQLEPFAARLTWHGEPGEVGLPLAVPDFFGGAFRRRVEGLVEREVAAEARRLKDAALRGQERA
jgi:hypothetical protein